MTDEENVIFREVQRFGLWFWAALIIAAAGGVTATIAAVSDRDRTGMPSVALLIVVAVIVPLAIAVLFIVLRLETEVRRDGVYLRFYPFHIRHRRFARQDIAEYHACEYSPIRDYGGWGIRYGAKGKAYNVRGKKGVQLVFENGKRLLVGSQRPEELVKAIDSIG